MISFYEMYKKVLLEAGRPAKLAPSLLDPDTNTKLQGLLSKVNTILKYGVSKYPKLIDSNGEPAYGLDDSVLQERKLRYFYFYISNHNHNMVNDDGYNLDKRLFNSNLEMKNYLKSKNLWRHQIPTKQRIMTAIIHKIKDNPEIIHSQSLEKNLFNPTNFANFINVSREKFHHTSIAAAKKREDTYNMGIKDIDMVKAANRDVNTELNRRAAYNKMRKVKNF